MPPLTLTEAEPSEPPLHETELTVMLGTIRLGEPIETPLISIQLLASVTVQT